MIPTSADRNTEASPSVDIEPPGCEVLVVGCGNLLRGDDGVGPVLVRHLWERGVPAGARLVDGGTAGMDVAFQMRGASRVVIVDAAATGSAPGTLFRVPGAELAELPPLEGVHTHSFRWDNAIALASAGPIQMGSTRSPSFSWRITTGVFVVRSSPRWATLTSIMRSFERYVPASQEAR